MPIILVMYLKRSSEFLLRSIEHLKSRTVMRMKGTEKREKKKKRFGFKRKCCI